MLPEAVRVEIRRLYYAEHWKVGTIAGELGVHHEAVRKAIGQDRFVSRGDVRPSHFDAFVEFVQETLSRHPRLRATRIHQMIRSRGYRGSVSQLRRRIVQLGLRPRRAEAFLRLQTAPGEQAQVDWAHIGKLQVGRHERPVYAFVMILSWSRALYVDFSFDMTAAAVARGHVRAFEALGGVARQCLYDNMKTVVVERVGDIIRFHPRLLELAGHYHFAPRVCRPRRGNEKGRVERAIRYLRESFLAARVFTSIADLNKQFAEWYQTVALVRACPQDPDSTVQQAWEHEKSMLLPLPDHPLHGTDVRAVCAHKQPYIRFDRNLYSIPSEHVGKALTLVASDRHIEIRNGDNLLAEHPRSWAIRQVIEAPEHIEELKARKKAARHHATRTRLLTQVPAVEKLYTELVACAEPIAPQTKQLDRLLETHGADALQAAVLQALERGTPRAASVAHILERDARQRRFKDTPPLRLPADRPELSEPRVQNHSLEDYDDIGR